MVENIKIAYIGGGSRGWAWGLMSDLAGAEDISGEVALYDIDKEAALANEKIGNKINELEDAKSVWNYKAYDTLAETLKGAQFVVISILPGTFKEMGSDVHCPEKYGIYQPVGDTTGPGGVIRALRTIPMFEEIALAINENCPDAWVINYTNPMAMCVSTLYKVFPEIKAFGCCHEVFGTQNFLKMIMEDELGITDVDRSEIKVNVVGVNHFTWLTSAQYRDIDLFPIYADFCKKNVKEGYTRVTHANWINSAFYTKESVKMDLFNRFGYIAAAGDRHLAEFCDKEWYLANPERVKEMNFALTSVQWRLKDLNDRLERGKKLLSGEETFTLKPTGEEGVNQIRALLGLCDLVTNVNIPNYGQIPNLPLGVVVETNATFRSNSLQPVLAGNIPDNIYPLISRNVGTQEMVVQAALERNLDKAFAAFIADPLVDIGIDDAKKLFDEMIDNTKEYLGGYNI